jgi:hypothetical protein
VNSTVNRSTFVTVVAWIFIALSGFGTAISIIQNIMIQTIFNSPQMEQALRAPTKSGTPPLVTFMTAHFQIFFFAFLVVSAITLASSIGLLRRKNWARLIFVGLMVLGVLWNLGGPVLQFVMFSSMQNSFSSAPGAPEMEIFFIAMSAVSILFALGFSGLLGWIAKRLLSQSIAAEFRQ